MRILTISNLYPSSDLPRHGIFVEERLRHLLADSSLDAEVIALRPVSAAAAFLRPMKIRSELRHEIPVHYQAVPSLPMLTNWIDPWLWANAAAPCVRRLLSDKPDATLIDAHFLYPDGAAAVILGRRLGVPVLMTARGSDVNVKASNAVMRRWIRWAAKNCAGLITVSQALADRLEALNIRAPAIEVLPNGVDLEKFRPGDRATCRARFQLQGRIVASVGHLVPDKGHHIALEAISRFDDVSLLIVGEGPQRASLKRLARKLGIESRVRFLGLVPHGAMADVYNAADVLVLPSLREGMPNVILESLACGTPVVATDVGGIGEVITAPEAGRLIGERSGSAVRGALADLFLESTAVERTRRFAERFAWKRVVDRQLALYGRILDASMAAGTGDPRVEPRR